MCWHKVDLFRVDYLSDRVPPPGGGGPTPPSHNFLPRVQQQADFSNPGSARGSLASHLDSTGVVTAKYPLTPRAMLAGSAEHEQLDREPRRYPLGAAQARVQKDTRRTPTILRKSELKNFAIGLSALSAMLGAISTICICVTLK